MKYKIDYNEKGKFTHTGAVWARKISMACFGNRICFGFYKDLFNDVLLTN